MNRTNSGEQLNFRNSNTLQEETDKNDNNQISEKVYYILITVDEKEQKEKERYLERRSQMRL